MMPSASSANPSPVTVVIAGLGLLGGSLGLALKHHPEHYRVLGLARRQKSIDQALQMKIVDGGGTCAEKILPQADITVVCLPVSVTIDFIRDHAEHWRPNTIVTDVGSVKEAIVNAGQTNLAPRGIHFIGSHPMAGSEKSGLDVAHDDLYRNAMVFVTETKITTPIAVEKIHALWRHVGANVHAIGLQEHDTLVAHTSHFLHLLAPAALNVALAPENAVLGTAGGFRDTTRIAASSPQMWIEIFDQNRDKVLDCITDFQHELDRFVHALKNKQWDQLETLLDEARKKRLAWDADWTTRREAQS